MFYSFFFFFFFLYHLWKCVFFKILIHFIEVRSWHITALWPPLAQYLCLWMLQRCHSYMESFQWGLCRPQCLGCWLSGPLQDLDFQPWSKFSNVLTWIGLRSLTLSLAHLEDLIPSVGGLCSCSRSLSLSLKSGFLCVYPFYLHFHRTDLWLCWFLSLVW